MISVAMLSRWHVHANDYARQAGQHPDIRIAAVWDEQPERGRAWANELGVPFYERLEDVLGRADIDGVIVDAPTNMHRAVITAAARARKHVFTEKVLGLTVRECDEILAAVADAGVQLMLSLPRLTDPYYLAVQKLVDAGQLGAVTSVRCRLAHNGAVPSEGRPHGWLPAHFFDPVACGGGALIDLGAHPIYLANRLAGRPKAVTARFHSVFGHPVEDNAAVIVEYETGALAVLETGFTSGGSPFLLEVHGTDGSVMVEDTQVRARARGVQNGEWFAPEPAAAVPRPLEQWAAAIASGAGPTIGQADMRALTLVNEAAALSAQDGRRVEAAAIG